MTEYIQMFHLRLREMLDLVLISKCWHANTLNWDGIYEFRIYL